MSFSDSAYVLDLFKPRSINELNRLNQEAQSDAEKINALFKFCASIYTDPYEVKTQLSQAYILAKKRNSKKEIGLCYLFGINQAHSVKGIDSCAAQARQIFNELGDAGLDDITTLFVATALYRYGTNYVEPFRLIEQFTSSYGIAGDRLSMAKAYTINGEIFRTLENYPEAIKHYKKSAKYSYENGELVYPSPLINIGTVYLTAKKFDSAFYYYNEVSTKYYKNRTTTHAYLATRKAQAHLLQKNYPEAIALANESLQLYRSINHEDGIALASGNLAAIYYKMGQIDNCINYGEQTYRAAIKDNYFPHETQEAMRLTALAYRTKNNLTKAFEFQQIYIENYQKYFGQRVNIDLFNEQMKLSRENQQLERSFLIDKQKQTEELVNSHRNFIIIIIAALIIAISGAVLLYRKNKTIEKLNNNLLSYQIEILDQAEKLKANNDEIEAINSNLERLVAERSQKVIDQNSKLTEYAYFNAHKVRGPLARILGLINVFEKELTQHTLQEYADMLKQAGKELDQSISDINKILERDE